jgi:hypothetical protein
MYSPGIVQAVLVVILRSARVRQLAPSLIRSHHRFKAIHVPQSKPVHSKMSLLIEDHSIQVFGVAYLNHDGQTSLPLCPRSIPCSNLLRQRSRTHTHPRLTLSSLQALRVVSKDPDILDIDDDYFADVEAIH